MGPWRWENYKFLVGSLAVAGTTLGGGQRINIGGCAPKVAADY